MNPILIPILIQPEPDRCPQCHKEKKIKEVCAHCNYEYPPERFFRGFGLAIGWAAVIGAIVGSLMMTGDDYNGGKSFADYILGGLMGTVTGVMIVMVIGGLIFLVEETFFKKKKS